MNNVELAATFEDLKTVNDQPNETFVEASLALGLIEDDEKWKRATDECASFWMIVLHCLSLRPLDW